MLSRIGICTRELSQIQLLTSCFCRKLASDWRRSGVGLASNWRGTGVKQVSDWRRTGVGQLLTLKACKTETPGHLQFAHFLVFFLCLKKNSVKFSFLRHVFVVNWCKLALDWRQTGIGLASEWRRTGVGLALDWRRTGGGLAADWRQTGVGLASDRCGTGVGLVLDSFLH